MGYVIKKGAGVWRPVRWDEAADGGGIETQEISVKFRRFGIEEAAEINRKAGAGDLKMGAFFEEVALGWEGAADEDGPLPFTPAGRATMLDVPGFPAALELAFWQMFGAVQDDRAGNSKASPAGGPAAGGATAEAAPGTTV